MAGSGHLLSLQERLQSLLLSHPQGLSNADLLDHFGPDYELLVPVLNELLDSHHIAVFKMDEMLVYKTLDEKLQQQLEGLTQEHMLVYQTIQQAGSRGIWTRDIKKMTGIGQEAMTKLLRALEKRKLVKSIHPLTSKTKKIYLDYQTTPDRELLTGGPWFSEQGYDQELVERVHSNIMVFIRSVGIAGLPAIMDRVKVMAPTITMSDLELVVEALVYDMLLEEVPSAVLALSGLPSTGKHYRLTTVSASTVSQWDYLADMPCGRCPVIAQCSDDAIISPAGCVYFNAYLTNAQHPRPPPVTSSSKMRSIMQGGKEVIVLTDSSTCSSPCSIVDYSW